MMTLKHALVGAGLLAGLVLAGPASAVPAGPSAVQAGAAPIAQAQMTRRERRMMRRDRMDRRMMRRDRMERRSMRRRTMKRRMMRNR